MSIFLSIQTCLSQPDAIDNEISDLKSKYQIPLLSKKQMTEDFDSLIKIMASSNAQIYLRKKVENYDVLNEISNLKKEIGSIERTEDFIILLYMALRATLDEHCQIGTDVWYWRNYVYKNEFKKYNDEDFSATFKYQDIINSRIKTFCYFKYIDGRYYLKYPIVLFYNNDSIQLPTGTEIEMFNNEKISDYINNNITLHNNVAWDPSKKMHYANELKYIDSIHFLSIRYFDKHKKVSLVIDSIANLHNFAHFNIVNFLNEKSVEYFSEDSVLYIRCPLMIYNFIKYYKTEILKLRHLPIKKIIIDIRGNYGGDDRVWISILQNLISDKITYKYQLICLNNKNCYDFIRNKFGKLNRKKIIYPSWSESKSFLVAFENVEKIKPARKSLKLNVPIYILQDDEIYSSASCFSSLAKDNCNLTSVGISNNKLGGMGVESMSFILPNSRMIFMLDIMLSNSNVKEPEDAYFNKVEKELNLPIEYFIDRGNFNGNIYSKEYLYHSDFLYKTLIQGLNE